MTKKEKLFDRIISGITTRDEMPEGKVRLTLWVSKQDAAAILEEKQKQKAVNLRKGFDKFYNKLNKCK